MSFAKCMRSITPTTVEDRNELRDFMAENKGGNEAETIKMYMADLDGDLAGLRTQLTEQGFDATYEAPIPEVVDEKVQSEQAAPVAEFAPKAAVKPVKTATETRKLTPDEQYEKRRTPDYTKDSLLVAAAKEYGGIDVDAFDSVDEGILKNENKRLNYVERGVNKVTRGKGLKPSDLAEYAVENGYALEMDDHQAAIAASEELGGKPTYTPDGWENQTKLDAIRRDEEEALRELEYEPTEYEEYTKGMSEEQRIAFTASVAMDIEPVEGKSYEDVYMEAYDDYAQRMDEESQGGTDFALEQETESQRESRESDQAEAEKEAQEVEKAAQKKADIDSEVGDFFMTGSDRKEDVKAAEDKHTGQGSIFDAPAEPVTKAPESKITAKPETGKPLSEIRINEDRETEAGDTVMISRKADVVMKEIDSRIDNLKLLSKCISG